MPDPTPRRPSGPPPETLQIEGNWEAALKKGLTKAPPPKPVKKARKRKKK